MTSVLPPALRMVLSSLVERGLGASAKHGGGSQSREFAGNGGADAASGSGDEGDLPGERGCGVHI